MKKKAITASVIVVIVIFVCVCCVVAPLVLPGSLPDLLQ